MLSVWITHRSKWITFYLPSVKANKIVYVSFGCNLQWKPSQQSGELLPPRGGRCALKVSAAVLEPQFDIWITKYLEYRLFLLFIYQSLSHREMCFIVGFVKACCDGKNHKLVQRWKRPFRLQLLYNYQKPHLWWYGRVRHERATYLTH